MERFKIIRPSPVLSAYIRHYWLLESDDVTQKQRVTPTGNIELLFHRSCPMKYNGGFIPLTSLSGQSLSYADLLPTGAVSMIAVVFQPYGAKAFFDMPVNEISELIVSADDLHIASLKELEEQILATTDDDTCIRLIEAFLLRRLHPQKEYNYRRMAAAVSVINQSGSGLSVSRLAETVCLSEKQFRRIFSEYVGTGPKEFMRIVRFHKALYTLQNNPAMSFTALAYECGYYDQAHLTHEFKLFSGYTPREYVSVCAPYSDYFSL